MHIQVVKQAIVAHVLFAGLFGIISNSLNKIRLDAQMNEYNKKLSTTANAYDTSQVAKLQNIHKNHPLS